MEQALAGLKCKVIQSTSDEAPGLRAYVEHHLGAHHSPDIFPVQHELSKAVSAPMALKQRAAAKAVAQAEETLKRVQESRDNTNGACAKRGPGRPPKAAACLEQVAQDVATARHEHQRLAGQRETVTQSIRAIGHAYHFVTWSEVYAATARSLPGICNSTSPRSAPWPSRNISARRA